MNATINAAALIIRNDVKVEGSDKPLFSVFEEGKERAGLTFGLGKARKLAMILDDPDMMAEFKSKLYAFVDEADAVETPVYTVEYDGKTYGLFLDDTIKRQDTRDGKTFWRLPKAGSRITTILKPDHFTGRLELPAVEPANAGKPGRPAGTKNPSVRDEMNELKAMLAQLLAAKA